MVLGEVDEARGEELRGLLEGSTSMGCSEGAGSALALGSAASGASAQRSVRLSGAMSCLLYTSPSPRD
eukprot:6963927-Alexandrium_andersonii.AAC.1